MERRSSLRKHGSVALSLLVLLAMLFFSCPVKRSLFSTFLPSQTDVEQSILSNTDVETVPCSASTIVKHEMKWIIHSSQKDIQPANGSALFPTHYDFNRKRAYLSTSSKKSHQITKAEIQFFLWHQSFLI